MKFLKSERFWKLVISAITWSLLQYGFIPLEIATPLIALLLGSAGVRTIDRFSESVGGYLEE